MVNPENNRKTLERIKEALRETISEWVGHDMPEEGDEDFDTLETNEAWVESIESIDEAVDYLEVHGIDAEEFLESLDINLPAR